MSDFPHSDWESKYIVPALTDAESVLFFNDPQVGWLGCARLECFLWAFLMNMMPSFARLPARERQLAFSNLVVTSATKNLQRSGLGVDDKGAEAVLGLWFELLVNAGGIIESAVSTADMQRGPSEWMRDYLRASEGKVPASARHKAFPVSASGGDLVLCMAAVAGCQSIINLMQSDLATTNAELAARRSALSLDVFVSYHRPERPRAKLLAEALARQGFSVWLDDAIVPGDNFTGVVDERVRMASAVVVCWSSGAASSKWVHSEALVGHDQNTLAPALLSRCTIPTPFNSIHTEDLSTWSGDVNAAPFQALAARIHRLAELRRKR